MDVDRPLATPYAARHLTDTRNLNRHMLYQAVTQRHFFALFLVRQDHLVQRVSEHEAAVFQVRPLGDDLGPLDQWPMYPESILTYLAV